MDGFKAVQRAAVVSPEAAPQLRSAVLDVHPSLGKSGFFFCENKDHLLHPKHWKLSYGSVLRRLFSQTDILPLPTLI